MFRPRRILLALICGVLLAFMPVTATGAATSLKVAERRHRHRRHRHRHHSRHRHHEGHHHKRIDAKHHLHSGKKELSLLQALDHMPTKVSEMFALWQSSKSDQQKAVDVLKQLNLVYERALTQKDVQTPECEEKKAALGKEVSQARNGLKDVEGHLTQLQGHMQTIQTGIDRNLAEVESMREQYEAHRDLCKKNKEDSAKMLALLQQDMPIAKNVTDKVTAGCKLPKPEVPALTECSLPNGEFVTTFKSPEFRKLISSCSGITEKVAALNLDRSVRGRNPVKASAAAAFLQLQSQRLRGASSTNHHAHERHHKKHHKKHEKPAPVPEGIGLIQRSREQSNFSLMTQEGHKERLLQKYLSERTIPQAWCTDVKPGPTCEAFTDSMYTFLGNVEDLTRDLLSKSQGEEEHCRGSLEMYEEQVKSLRRQADDGSVALANAAAEHSELATLRRERRAQVQDVNRDADREVGTCGQQLADFEATLGSARKLRQEMGDSAGKGLFMGDCEVSDWITGPCSESCGTTGTQTLTREVISSVGPVPKCPSLKFTRACNRRPCPVDGRMGHWEPWSQCSRACGGGTRARHRQVLQEAQHGGLPIAETMQEQLCNTQPCDQDCLMSAWSPWTTCSKVCNRGHTSRTKKVLRAALGEGKCPGEKSAERLQTLPCGKKACDKLLPKPDTKCMAKLDVALVLDVSGSVGAQGTEKLKTFAKSLSDRLKYGEDGVNMGLVYYGSKASVAAALSTASADVDSSLTKVVWQKDGTNTAQALGLARTLFEERGRPGVQKVVIVVTDGMPESTFLTGVEVGRLKDTGARLSFISVGKSVSQHVLQRWSSWPWEENIVETDTFGSMDAKKVTDVLANLCGNALA